MWLTGLLLLRLFCFYSRDLLLFVCSKGIVIGIAFLGKTSKVYRILSMPSAFNIFCFRCFQAFINMFSPRTSLSLNPLSMSYLTTIRITAFRTITLLKLPQKKNVILRQTLLWAKRFSLPFCEVQLEVNIFL